ncbi:uncharacterized protein LOC125666438 [Ostrea edulis]|uniref:uncharacterized protein LOC125666438 n=1 Tax=Ostrea edulis TaxID=37623 RepID=UPI0020959FA6|nr:uncharacterized protein LOC125666438 [Ostrea edulis]
MGHNAVFGLTLFAVILGITLSITPTKYFECEEYPGDETVDQTRRDCIREKVNDVERLFCKYWECTTPSCPEAERLTADDGCQFCPGTCTINGKIYEVGTGTSCIDNVNSCYCVSTGSVIHTLVGYNRNALCNAPNPET